MIERARRHAVASCLACIAGLALVLVLAYWVGPIERLDRSVLDALSAPTGSFANEAAYAAVKLADPVAFVIAATVAALIALARSRIWDAVFAVALIAGTGLLDLALQALISHPRYRPIPAKGAYPFDNSYPSGHSAGALAISLAFLTVVPPSWRRPTAAVGVLYTLAVSFSLPVINYHFPSDVLGGWFLAAGWWFALLAAFGRCGRKLTPSAAGRDMNAG
jgi:membrane-associated phospholipid phosphatase